MAKGPVGEPDLLEGNGLEMIITTPNGRVMCTPHHNDWDRVDWEAQLGADESL